MVTIMVLYHGITMVTMVLYHDVPWYYSMVLPWYYHDSTMVLSWYYGTFMVLYHDSTMVLSWYSTILPWYCTMVYHGNTMVIPWYCTTVLLSHPSTNWARRCLTSVIGREPVYSAWYGRRQMFLFLTLFIRYINDDVIMLEGSLDFIFFYIINYIFEYANF